MIYARMAHHHVVYPDDLSRPQEWGNDRFAGVEFARRRSTRIYQQYFGIGEFNHRRVTLPHVEMRNADFGARPALAPPVPSVSGKNRRGHGDSNDCVAMSPD